MMNMPEGFIAPLLAFVISALITFILLVIGLISWLRTKRFLAQALKTTGMVVENVARGSMYSPKVRFTAADGRVCEFVEMIGSRPPKFKAGDAVPVYYHLENFSKARAVRNLAELYYSALIAGGLGGVFFLMLCLLGGVFAVIYTIAGPMGG